MWVQFLKSPQGFGYFVGDKADLPEELTEKLISEGYAVPITDTPAPVSDLPLDLKGREALIKAGLTTIEQVLSAKETLTDIKGVGEKSASEIIEALTKKQ